mmetsp:Transcript_16293/g.28171  ORF Transcript_16293/g.28171 Transcript_16293/m.28171 type:complete len:241 (+) Transcript_16293:1212-1934(+)
MVFVDGADDVLVTDQHHHLDALIRKEPAECSPERAAAENRELGLGEVDGVVLRQPCHVVMSALGSPSHFGGLCVVALGLLSRLLPRNHALPAVFGHIGKNCPQSCNDALDSTAHIFLLSFLGLMHLLLRGIRSDVDIIGMGSCIYSADRNGLCLMISIREGEMKGIQKFFVVFPSRLGGLLLVLRNWRTAVYILERQMQSFKQTVVILLWSLFLFQIRRFLIIRRRRVSIRRREWKVQGV